MDAGAVGAGGVHDDPGSVVGVAQTNLKRMLAYSSIAHGGYLSWR